MRFPCHVCLRSFPRRFELLLHCDSDHQGHQASECPTCTCILGSIRQREESAAAAPQLAITDEVPTAATQTLQQESREAAASPVTECMDDEIHALASTVVVKREAFPEDQASTLDSSETTEEWQERVEPRDCRQDALLPPSCSSDTVTWDLMDDVFGPLVSLRLH